SRRGRLATPVSARSKVVSARQKSSSCQHPEVDHAENDNPDHVHEVPVVADRAECIGLAVAEHSLSAKDQKNRQDDQAAENVQAMEAGNGEERRAEEAAVNSHAVTQQPQVFERLVD